MPSPPAQLIEDTIAYIAASPTAFHATTNAARLLDAHGFQRLDETAAWRQPAAGDYYVTRNDSSLVCWRRPDHAPAHSAFRMACAHTDSPCLKLKPSPLLEGQGCIRLGIEVYGSALLSTWFDRELSLAGRVSWQDATDGLHDELIDFQRPLAILPSLAIHLDREANGRREIDRQQHLNPILVGQEGDETLDFSALLARRLDQEHPGRARNKVLDFDLFLYDAQPPRRLGLTDELLCGGRLDNLLSCYLGLRALLDTRASTPCLLALYDHEEVGSQSQAGAQGTLLEAVLRRICPASEDFYRCVAGSNLLSIDNAHAVHPNYPDRSEPQHAPRLNRGPVLKRNAGQRYATSSRSAALFRAACARAEIPVQDFVMQNSLSCGSTIGPLISSGLGVVAADVGVPSLAMHSARETAGCRDAELLYLAIRAFMTQAPLEDEASCSAK
ncbi:MAG: M18 family aminopeptidase [Desulfobulbaceae bacterium A2]|nr:MAG: M18 family aminopeptidase [Desulfobulbaceae bacterium A2]